MACELLAWTRMLALDGPPALGTQTPALAAFSAAGRIVAAADIAAPLAATWPWATQLTAAITRLRALALG